MANQMSVLFRVLLSALLSFYIAGSALAQTDMTRPQYYVVAGVAQNDVLNVRGAANSTADIVGELEPGSGPIEVLFESGNWGYIVSGEANGYVSLSYLKPVLMSRVENSDLPVGTTCFGNEPFWSIEFSQNKMTFSDYSLGDGSAEAFNWTDSGSMGNTGTYSSFLRAQNQKHDAVMVVSNRICSDGMSDRNYPREISVLMFGGEQTRSFSGCCMVPALQ